MVEAGSRYTIYSDNCENVYKFCNYPRTRLGKYEEQYSSQLLKDTSEFRNYLRNERLKGGLHVGNVKNCRE